MVEYDDENYVYLSVGLALSGLFIFLASLNFKSESQKWPGGLLLVIGLAILLYVFYWFSNTRTSYNNEKEIVELLDNKKIEVLIDKLKEEICTEKIISGLIEINAIESVPELIKILNSDFNAEKKLIILDALVYFGGNEVIKNVNNLIEKTDDLNFKFQFSLANMKLTGRNKLGEKTIETMLKDEKIIISEEEIEQYEEVKKELRIYENRNQIRKSIENISGEEDKEKLIDEYQVVIKMQQDEIEELNYSLKELNFSVSHEEIIRRKMNRIMMEINETSEDEKETLTVLNALYIEYENMLKDKKRKFFDSENGKAIVVGLIAVVVNTLSIVLTWVFSK